MEQVTIFTALFAGFLSFVSPCVLPLIPAYLSFISGLSVEELKSTTNRAEVWRRVSLNSLAFILGFSVVFVALGASASAIGQFLQANKYLIEKVAGVVIVIFGIHFTGLFRIKWLDYERKMNVQVRKVGLFGAFILGFAFAFGWTPCIGPILGSILAIAATQETIWKGIGLLFVYSMGLGIPFFLSGLFMNLFFSAFQRAMKYMRIIEIVAGVFLIIVGVLVFTGKLAELTYYLPQWNVG